MSIVNLCFDIETAPRFKELEDVPEQERTAFENWASRKFPETEPSEAYLQRAGIVPEFSQVVCISAIEKGQPVISFYQVEGNPEKVVLQAFAEYLSKFPRVRLVGHNIKKFDIPFLRVRYAANGLTIPPSLQCYGVKPWESVHWDTLEIWLGGVFGSTQSASLETVCSVLGIESPKAEFSGAQVGEMFHSDDPDRIQKIVKYCERDVLATATACAEMARLKMF